MVAGYLEGQAGNNPMSINLLIMWSGFSINHSLKPGSFCFFCFQSENEKGQVVFSRTVQGGFLCTDKACGGRQRDGMMVRGRESALKMAAIGERYRPQL